MNGRRSQTLIKAERRGERLDKARKAMRLHGRRTGEVHRNAVTKRAGRG